MSDNIAIKVENLTKIYKLYTSPQDRLKEAINPFGTKYHHDFYALNDVSFEICRGETVAIIGQNGSGKSTLLKTITGILTPSSGSVSVKGRISALLELGAGFNPQMTGLENVFFNGTIMGYTRDEMTARLDDILSFADIGEFIHQPVKTYSSGMFVRLAFAVAVHIEPEILIVDEALSVGDVMFQSKCFSRIKSLMAGGVTTLFVTHNMNTVTALCNRAFMIDGGRIYCTGSPKEVTFSYYQLQREREHARMESAGSRPAATTVKKLPIKTGQIPARAQTQQGEERFGLGTAKIIDFKIYNHDNEETDSLETGKKFSVWVDIEFSGEVMNPAVGVMIKNPQGQALLGIHSFEQDRNFYGPKKAGDRLTLTLESEMLLNPGKFLMNIGIADHKTFHEYKNIDSRHNVASINVYGKEFYYGLINNPGIVMEDKLI